MQCKESHVTGAAWSYSHCCAPTRLVSGWCLGLPRYLSIPNEHDIISRAHIIPPVCCLLLSLSYSQPSKGAWSVRRPNSQSPLLEKSTSYVLRRVVEQGRSGKDGAVEGRWREEIRPRPVLLRSRGWGTGEALQLLHTSIPVYEANIIIILFAIRQCIALVPITPTTPTKYKRESRIQWLQTVYR